MIPAAFDYQRPSTLEEALGLVASGSATKILAGGQSLLPLLKLRLGAAESLVDIGRLSELKGYRKLRDGGIEIGALTTYSEWQRATEMPGIAEAIDQIADVQVRNRGTVGGSIAHADPASDMPAIALVFDASAVLRSAGGERAVPLDQFFLGPFTTDIAPGEILVAIRRPKVPENAAFAYRKLPNKASGYSIVGVAALIGSTDGKVSHARVAITGVGETAYRANAVEEALAGSDGSPGAIEAAAAHATEGVEVASDIHADRDYRTAMAAVYARRAIEAALARSS